MHQSKPYAILKEKKNLTSKYIHDKQKILRFKLRIPLNKFQKTIKF